MVLAVDTLFLVKKLFLNTIDFVYAGSVQEKDVMEGYYQKNVLIAVSCTFPGSFY